MPAPAPAQASSLPDSLGTLRSLDVRGKGYTYYSLPALEKGLGLPSGSLARKPVSVRIVLESLLRNLDDKAIRREDVEALARWDPFAPADREIPFRVARVLMQDFTGVAAVVDLAVMRDAVASAGGSPELINPQVPVDLIIDHSVQVDFFRTPEAFERNVQAEFHRNTERYEFLKWGQKAFENFRVVPPGIGICHQVNLEYLGKVVRADHSRGGLVAYPDTLVGTDSHTTMINGLGVVGWGVGGIEAEAAMLGQPVTFLTPRVIGVHLEGHLRNGVTATDLVLTVTQRLRQLGVVGQFVEFFGEGTASLSLPDRATIGNMAPEYGATIGFFPVDEETLAYLRGTGRSDDEVALVEAYLRAQGLFGIPRKDDVDYSAVVDIDLGLIEPSLAGPKLPQDRVPLADVAKDFRACLDQPATGRGFGLNGKPHDVEVPVEIPRGEKSTLHHGSVVIAAITSCTNTSNPSVMMAAGLLAKNAVERGLRVPGYVKTSLAPGSRVVSRYLETSGLLPYLEKLGFGVVGYGCTTCIGNSGPLPEEVSRAVAQGELVVAAVLSGNRNFEARIHGEVRANYLASPPLVVAFALAGSMTHDLLHDPLGKDARGHPIYFRDIWPSDGEIKEAVRQSLDPAVFRELYGGIETQSPLWNALPAPEGETFAWSPKSTYIRKPPFFEGFRAREVPGIKPIRDARALLILGDNITTDHISPAGAIGAKSAAGKYLVDHGVTVAEFNQYGTRRGNDEVMTRGTFANPRIKNLMVPGVEGSVTKIQPQGTVASVFDASVAYKAAGVPLVVLAGKNYGSGSSRDWAAKGTKLLGVRAVVAESYERIHRSNLIGMGVLPLQFPAGTNASTLGLTGEETFALPSLSDALKAGATVPFEIRRATGPPQAIDLRARVDTPIEVEYLRNGGILDFVLRQRLAKVA